MRLILIAALTFSCLIPFVYAEEISPDKITDILDFSVTIRSRTSQGSGEIVTRNGVNYVWTAAHVVDNLRNIREVIDQRTGSKKTLVEFDDAKIVKELIEDGRIVGRLEMDAEVIRYSDANNGEDLALLRVRKKNFIKGSVKFYLEDNITPIGTQLYHCGSLLGQIGSNSFTSGIMSQHGRVLNGIVYDQSTVAAFPGCITADAMISMADGTYKKMVDIKEGEYVLSFGTNINSIFSNNTNLRPVIKGKVSRFIESGIKDIYEIKTYNRTIKVSGNHPFVRINSFKNLSNNNINYMQWESADKLSEGDIVGIIKNHVPFRKSNSFNFANQIGQHGNKNNFMRLLGFYIGDGYSRVRESGGEVCLYTYNSNYESVYSSIIENIFNIVPKIVEDNSGRYLIIYNTDLAKKFNEWGVTGYAVSKRVPSWIFQCPVEQQKAFLLGVMEADGHNRNNSWTIELANQKLIEDLYMLSTHVGIRTSNIFTRNRTSSWPDKITQSETWGFDIYLGEYQEGAEILGNRDMLSNDLRYERIQKITKLAPEMTYDLTVDSYHNFFANGFLVHNSSGGGIYNKNGQMVGMIVRGAGETFNLMVPVRRIKSYAKRAGIEFAINEEVPVPSEEELRKMPVEDSHSNSFGPSQKSSGFRFLITPLENIP